jgi:hypothetical protein
MKTMMLFAGLMMPGSRWVGIMPLNVSVKTIRSFVFVMWMIGGPMLHEELLQAAAKALTGFDVTVRYQKPAVDIAAALCHQSEAGQRFIDINPALPYETQFWFFLHECGHWKIANGEMRRSDAHSWLPGSVGSGILGKHEEALAEEKAADELAARWDAWAEANANIDLYLINKTMAKAVQLLAYKTT